jgi:hypothetical protein
MWASCSATLCARRGQSEGSEARGRSLSIGRAVLHLSTGARKMASRVVRVAVEVARSSSLGRALNSETLPSSSSLSSHDKSIRKATRALRSHCSRKVSRPRDADLKEVKAFLEPAGLADLAPRFVALGLIHRRQILELDLKVYLQRGLPWFELERTSLTF